MTRGTRWVGALAAALAGIAPAGLTHGADGDDQPIGLGDDIPTRAPQLAWQTAVDCPEGSCAVALDDDTIYVLTPGKPAQLAAFDAADGREQWRRSPAVRATTFDVVGAFLVLHEPHSTTVIDRLSGDELATIPAAAVQWSDAGLIFSDDGATVAGWDAATGTRLWTRTNDVRLATACRDVVVLSPPGLGTIQAVDHRTGTTRWTTVSDYDLSEGTARCGGSWLYVTDGESMSELELANGFRNWHTLIDGAGRFEGLGENAIVFGDGEVTGIDLWDGEVLWSRPAADVGERVLGPTWLRTDGSTIFRLLPWSGDVLTSLAPFADDAGGGGGAEFEVVHSSESRLILRHGPDLLTVGVADLGESWTLALDTEPNWTGVSSGALLTVDDDSLDGYEVAPLTVDHPTKPIGDTTPGPGRP